MSKLNLVGSYRVGTNSYGPGTDIEVPDETAAKIKPLDDAKRAQLEQDAKFAQTMLPSGHPYLVLQGITGDAQPPQFDGEAAAPAPMPTSGTDVDRQRLQAEGEAQQPATTTRRTTTTTPTSE